MGSNPTLDTMELNVKEIYWNDNDLIIESDQGKYKLINAYPTSVRWDGLESTADDVVTIEMNCFYKQKCD